MIVSLPLLLVFLQSCLSTDRPIIGILTQELGDSFHNLPEAANYSSYLGASYVQWIESAGARVVPVIVDTTNSVDQTQYFQEVFRSVNGLVIPGGADKTNTSGFIKASKAFFQMAIQANVLGDVFPIWGTCLGFETLGFITNGGQEFLTRCNSEAQAVPLELEQNWRDSRLFGGAPGDVIDIVTSIPVTVNFHHWCLTRDNFTKFGLDNFWKIISVNSDLDGLKFVSSMEAQGFPFYGVQFHPEKNVYEWTPKYPTIPHSREAVHVAQYFAQYFVDQTRASNHAFPNRSQEEKNLIYNFPVFFSGREEVNSSLSQIYMFH